MYKKLSPTEITEVVDKIRKKYTEYCKRFFKTRRIKEEFEFRYVRALKSGVDISNFLLAEISVIQELIDKEEKRIEETSQPVKKEAPKQNFADRIIDENKKKLEKYPSFSFHRDASDEISRLVGALNQLYEKYFPPIQALVRKHAAPVEQREMNGQESQLRFFAHIGSGLYPSRLTRYYMQINRFPRDYKAIEWEEKDYILESAFLLHDLFTMLAKLKNSKTIKEESQLKNLDSILDYIWGMIEDFRLKDFKKRNKGGTNG